MKISLLAACVPGILFCQEYKLVPDWPTQAPKMIQVPGVAVDAKGHVLVLHRGPHPILEFEGSGKFIRSWGDGLFSNGKVVAVAPADRKPGASGYTAAYGAGGCESCGAHSIRVDPEGNIWAVDAPGHVIYKMNPQGKVILQLGQKGVSGIGPNNFNLPTDVAFAPNGDFYVTDGYGNPRVVKFSHAGKFLLQWGTRGNGPGQFQLPHNVAVDAQGRVYVTDRDNRRLEVFDASGKFLQEWPEIGGVSALRMTKDQHIWTGGILRDLGSKVLATLPGDVGTTHGIAVSESGDVYVGQLKGVAQKFVAQR